MRSIWLFQRRLRMLIGAGEFDRTEQLLRFAAARLGVTEVTATLERPAEQVRIDGWDTIGARMEDAKRYLQGDNKGREWRAVILGLRNDTEKKGLHVETLFSLSDQAEPSPARNDLLTDLQIRQQERMLATQARVPSTDFVTMDVAPLRLSGLDDLYALEVSESGARRDGRACTQDLAAAAVLLRFHQAVERHAMTEGLPCALPLYATVHPVSWPMEVNAINFGEVATRRLLPVIRDFTARTAELVAQTRREREAEFIRDTRRLVVEIREADAALALWPVWHNPFKRHSFAGMIASEREITRDILRRMHGVDAAGATGETLIRLLVEARHGKVTTDLLEDLPTQNRSELHQLKMAYAKTFGGPRVRAYLVGHSDRLPPSFA